MDLSTLASIFVCPTCGRAEARLEVGRAIACGACHQSYSLCGKSVQTSLEVGLSDAWKQKQVEGESRYRDEKYRADDTISRLFGGFIAATVDKAGVILDIGCGIRETPPPYVAELGLRCYVGVEPLAQAMPRTYACLAGAVVEKIPVQDAAAAGMIFATSLDHIEDLGPAFREARRVLAKAARLYFWVGLYEPENMPKTVTFDQAFMRGSLPSRVARFALMQVVYARLLQRMALRGYKLRRNIPLDEKHFRYFTRDSLMKDLTSHGLRIERTLTVPGSSSIFVEARFEG